MKVLNYIKHTDCWRAKYCLHCYWKKLHFC